MCTDKAVDHLRVLHQNGVHNHAPSHESLKCAQRLSNINNNISKMSQASPAKYSSGGVRKNVAKMDRGMEHVNTSNGAHLNFTQTHNQDIQVKKLEI